MRNLIRRAFSVRGRPALDHDTRIDRIARGVVRRIATGSVRLQLGDFVEKRDLDRQFDRIKEYRFVSD